MEDQAKYLSRPKLDDNKTEIFRIYYNPSEISFDLFLWLGEAIMQDAFVSGCKMFKAFPSENIGTFIVSKN